MPYELIQLGRAQTLELHLERRGEPVVTTDAHITITAPDGTVVVDDEPATPGEVTRYTVAPLDPDDYHPGEGWGVRWRVTIDGEEQDIATPAIVVLRLITPRIGDSDIRREFPDLDARNRSSLTVTPSWQGQIDSAWRTIQIRLIESGRRPWLVSDYALMMDAHIALAASRAYRTLSARGHPRAADMSESLERKYEQLMARAQLRYSRDETGRDEDTRGKRGAVSQLYLSRPPRSSR